MTTHKEALTLALETLKYTRKLAVDARPAMTLKPEASIKEYLAHLKMMDEAIAKAKEALAQPEQEPLDTPLPCDVKVGHVTIRKGVALSVLVARMQVLYEMALLQQQKPLTDEQLEKGRDKTFSINNPFCPCDSKTFRKVARWVEAAHGIKGDA